MSKNESPVLDAIDARIGDGVARLLHLVRTVVWPFCRTYWWWTGPAAYLFLALILNQFLVGLVWSFIGFLVCLAIHRRALKRQQVPSLSPDEEVICYYKSNWKNVAKNAGLAQKAPVRAKTWWEAYDQVVGQPSDGKRINQLMKDPDADLVFPEVVRIVPAPLGYTHTVQLLDGQTVDTFARRADVLAELWKVKQVRVSRGVPGQVLLTPVIYDPLTDIDAITADNFRHFEASVKSVQIGLLEEGTPWNFPLDVHSIVAGNSGGGKSVAYRAVLSQMALIPDLQIIGIDLKRGIELKSWRPRLSATAKDMETALDALHEVWKIAEQRLDFLEERGFTDMKDYGFSPKMPRIVVLIDECSELFAVGEPDKELAQQGKKAIALVSKMLRLVRAAGVTIIMATQRPSTEVVPSGIRELTQNRVAFRMMNSAGAVMALGELPDNSISPVDIAQANKGRAVVADDQGNYSFAQCRFIEPETAKFIAEETSLLTRPLAALTLTSGATDNGIHTQEGEII